MDATVISTRIRLARNVDGLPFPHKLKRADALGITDSVSRALMPLDKFVRYDMSGLSQLDGAILQEKHLISPDLLSNSPFGAVLISADETVSVMVNEEDHIREQVIMPGLALDNAYDRINGIDDVLSKSIKLAYSPRFGYLTSCATNLGTGMRASVMMFLPALTMCNSMEACINDVGRLNMTVRGVYGEGSKADGYLYQISNQRTLGMTEKDIISAVRSAINYVSDAELRARTRLKANEPELKDKIYRAWGVATNAYKLSTGEAMQILALIRLGAFYGYIGLKSDAEFQNLITGCQPANMQRLSGKNMSVDERDIMRAGYVASILRDIAVRSN